MKSFLYQGLARALTASSPPVSGSLTVHIEADPCPLHVRQRTPWHEPQTFVNAAAIPLPDPRVTFRYPTAEPLPVRIRKFHSQHAPVCSRDGLTLPTLPAPQRAYVELTPPNPCVRRFRAEQYECATPFAPAALPAVVRLFGGSSPNPMRGVRVGACHFPPMTFAPQEAMPIPTQVYATCDLPPHRRPFVAPEALSASPWFTTSVYPPFSANEMPAAKRLRLVPESPAFIRDFAAPPYCWSQAAELPLRRRPLPPIDTTFAGSPDKAPPMAGHATTELPVPRAKGRSVIDPPQASLATTRNERTLPGAWRFELEIPERHRPLAVWLLQSFVAGPSQPIIVPPAPSSPCRFITLVGTDETDIALTGDGDAPRTIAITGTDNTAIGLGGEC